MSNEHLALSNVEDVKQGIIASKIVANDADIAKRSSMREILTIKWRMRDECWNVSNHEQTLR